MAATLATHTATDAATDASILRSDADGIATLILNRPAARNALSSAMMTALEAEIAAIAADPAVRVLVIGANGPAFCAGHDMREMRATPTREAYAALFGQSGKLMLSLIRLAKPVIARVQGTATAAGCQLVATCDLAVASSDAKFATPGVDIGLFCSTPMVAISRNVPRKRMMEMLLTGDPIDAGTAADYGLVNRVVAPEDLEAETRTLAHAHRRQIGAYHRHRQGSVLPPDRGRVRRRLQDRERGDDPQHAVARRRRRRRCVSRKTRAALGRPLRSALRYAASPLLRVRGVSRIEGRRQETIP